METNYLSPLYCASLLLETIPVVMSQLRAEMRHQRAPELNVPQLRVLIFIHDHPGTTLSVVADYIGVGMPSMSKMVDELFSRGLMLREESQVDRRCLTLQLTEPGLALLNVSREATLQYFAGILEKLSPEERQKISEAMELLKQVYG